MIIRINSNIITGLYALFFDVLFISFFARYVSRVADKLACLRVYDEHKSVALTGRDTLVAPIPVNISGYKIAFTTAAASIVGVAVLVGGFAINGESAPKWETTDEYGILRVNYNELSREVSDGHSITEAGQLNVSIAYLYQHFAYACTEATKEKRKVFTYAYPRNKSGWGSDNDSEFMDTEKDKCFDETNSEERNLQEVETWNGGNFNKRDLFPHFGGMVVTVLDSDLQNAGNRKNWAHNAGWVTVTLANGRSDIIQLYCIHKWQCVTFSTFESHIYIAGFPIYEVELIPGRDVSIQVDSSKLPDRAAETVYRHRDEAMLLALELLRYLTTKEIEDVWRGMFVSTAHVPISYKVGFETISVIDEKLLIIVGILVAVTATAVFILDVVATRRNRQHNRKNFISLTTSDGFRDMLIKQRLGKGRCQCSVSPQERRKWRIGMRPDTTSVDLVYEGEEPNDLKDGLEAEFSKCESCAL